MCARTLAFVYKVELAGKWPSNASTTLFFSDSKEYDERERWPRNPIVEE